MLPGSSAKYDNVQIPGSIGFDSNGDGTNDTFIGITSNAASADVNGIEFEGNALVGKDFAGDGSRFSINWSRWACWMPSSIPSSTISAMT